MMCAHTGLHIRSHGCSANEQVSQGDMESAASRNLPILLAFFILIATADAVPLKRVQKLTLKENRKPAALDDVTQMMNKEDIQIVKLERMDLETNDYPGSGANDRHTPKPP